MWKFMIGQELSDLGCPLGTLDVLLWQSSPEGTMSPIRDVSMTMNSKAGEARAGLLRVLFCQ